MTERVGAAASMSAAATACEEAAELIGISPVTDSR